MHKKISSIPLGFIQSFKLTYKNPQTNPTLLQAQLMVEEGYKQLHNLQLQSLKKELLIMAKCQNLGINISFLPILVR